MIAGSDEYLAGRRQKASPMVLAAVVGHAYSARDGMEWRDLGACRRGSSCAALLRSRVICSD